MSKNLGIGIVGLTMLLFGTTGLSGCAGSDSCSLDPNNIQALVMTTDYQSGSYALIHNEDHRACANVQPIHSDIICNVDKSVQKAFVVARFGADSLMWLDNENEWSVKKEISVGAGSNPQDIAVVSAERAYVTRYQSDKILIINPTSGEEIGTVDIKDYADGDGFPEAGWALHHLGKVYVQLHRLENFMPTEYSSLLVLDGASGEVEAELKLKSQTPYAKLRYSQAVDRIVVGETGNFGVNDGGVQLLDPNNQTLDENFIVTEETLGGDISDVVIASAQKGYAVVGMTQEDFSVKTKVTSFNPTTGEKILDLLLGTGFDHGLIELNTDGSELWVSDRTPASPGIRIFNTIDDTEKTQEPMAVGLPPYMICFVQ